MCAVFKHCFHFDVLCLCGLPLLEAQEGSQIFLQRDFFSAFLFQFVFLSFFPLDLRDLSGSLWLWSLSSRTAPQSCLQLLLVSNFSSGSCHLLLPAGHIHAEGWGNCGPGQTAVVEAAEYTFHDGTGKTNLCPRHILRQKNCLVWTLTRKNL